MILPEFTSKKGSLLTQLAPIIDEYILCDLKLQDMRKKGLSDSIGYQQIENLQSDLAIEVFEKLKRKAVK